MRILAVAVWLKLKRRYSLMGMAKEACEHFQVRAKQLFRVLMGHKYLGGKKTPMQKGKGKKRKDAPLLTLPRGPRRAETTGTNLPSKSRPSVILHKLIKDSIIHYHLQLKCIHLIKCTKVLKRHSISIHPSHHSPFTVPIQAAHTGSNCVLYMGHAQFALSDPQRSFSATGLGIQPVLLYNYSPVTTHNCLSPSQLCCCNTNSCDNIGRTLVLFFFFFFFQISK